MCECVYVRVCVYMHTHSHTYLFGKGSPTFFPISVWYPPGFLRSVFWWRWILALLPGLWVKISSLVTKRICARNKKGWTWPSGEGTLEKIRPSGSSLGLLLGPWPPEPPCPCAVSPGEDGTTGMVALPWAGFSGF